MNRLSSRDARLASGLILFAYVATHLANHALGSISMATAERGLRVAVWVWQSAPGTVLLYGAAATHVALAFAAVYQRRTLRMPPVELLRMVFGFGMPTLLIGHAVATRAASTIYGHPPDYAHVVWMLQHSGRQGMQIALLVPGWLHGCLGLRFAFGKRAWFARLRPILFGSALLLPVLAVTGFLAMTKEVNMLATDPTWAPRAAEAATRGEHETLDLLRIRLLLAYGAALAAVLLARHLRAFVEERRGALISVTFPHRIVRVPRGWSLLEASRAHGIAHRASCGGQGRCSTCRVRIIRGAQDCPPPLGMERSTLAQVKAEPDIRLACQLRPEGDVAVVPLIDEGTAPPNKRHREGLERDVVVSRVAVRWDRSYHLLMPHDRLYAIHRFHDFVEQGIDLKDITIGERENDHMVLWTVVSHVGDAYRALRSAAALADAVDDWAAELALTIGCRPDLVIALHRDLGVIDDPDLPSAARSVVVGDAFDAVRLATRHHEHWVAEQAGATPSALLVSTKLLDAAAPCLADRAGVLKVELADGRDISFVALARGGAIRGIQGPKAVAMTAIDRAACG